jgi:hypothetical protein
MENIFEFKRKKMPHEIILNPLEKVSPSSSSSSSSTSNSTTRVQQCKTKCNTSKLNTFLASHQGKITAFVLFLMSVINVTDRYTVSSALIDIEVYFDITKSTGGLLQTAFLLVYMAFSLPNAAI